MRNVAYATTVERMNSNIACWLSDRASSDPSLPAIKQGEHVLTYAALDGAAARCATLLADRGVTAGDRVALIMPNVAYFPIAYYAILRLGAVVVPMNPLLKAGEVSYAWNDAGVKVAVVFAMFAEEAAKAAEVTGTDVLVVTPGEFEQTLAGAEPHEGGPVVRTGDDTAVILYTSGTTGSPKGAELTHDNLGSNVRTDLATLMPLGPGDVVFGGLPLFHSFGQTCGLNAAIAGGACLTLLPKFDGEEALRIVAEDRVTVFLGCPDHVHGPARGARPGPVRHQPAQAGRLRRGVPAGGGALRGAAALRFPAARGVRAVGDLADRLLQPPGPAGQARLGGDPDRAASSSSSGDPTTPRSPPARWARSSSAART